MAMDYYLTNEIDIHPTAYLAPSVRIYGKVKIGAYSSIWDGVVIRGDMASIEIGENTSLQENAVVHVDSDIPTKIGNNVTVGHGAVVHGAEIGDFCIVAIKSVVLNNVKVGDYSIIGAGAIVMEGTRIPPESVVFGIPGKVAKKVTHQMKQEIRANARVYVELGQAYLQKRK